MDLQIDRSGPFAIAKVRGELSAAEAERFADPLEEIASGTGAALAIDLSGVTAIDSSGLSALIHVVTRSRLTHGRVLVVAPSPFVTGIFAITRLDQWFEICDSLDEAEQRFTTR